jgi:hypothetical protein
MGMLATAVSHNLVDPLYILIVVFNKYEPLIIEHFSLPLDY